MNNNTVFFVITIVTGKFTILILRKYGFEVCAILFGFWSYFLKVYIHLLCINTHRQTTTPFSLWILSSQESLPYWYYENTVLRFVWYRLVFIHLVFKFISIYPSSTHSNEQHHYFLRDCHFHGWVHCIVTTKIRF